MVIVFGFICPSLDVSASAISSTTKIQVNEIVFVVLFGAT